MSSQGTSVETTSGHRYNDELLGRADELSHARAEFPRFAFALDNPDLRTYFEAVDNRANDTKRRAQRAGLWSVAGTIVGLGIAASEPRWASLEAPWPDVLAVCSA